MGEMERLLRNFLFAAVKIAREGRGAETLEIEDRAVRELAMALGERENPEGVSADALRQDNSFQRTI